MKFLSYQEVSQVINIALGSATLESVRTPFKFIRPQIHLLLDGRIGSGKSTILFDVGKAVNQIPVTGLTRANILGTVDKDTKDFITPAIWDARNSALLVDEFDVGAKDFGGREALKSLLIIMEKSEYVKRISFAPREYNKKEKDLYCVVKNGKIACKTRFIFFGNTMMNLSTTQMQELKALASRCIVIPYYPTLDDLKRKARGEPDYIYKKILPKKKNAVISKPIYKEILTFIEDKDVRETKYLRLIGDLCRVFAITGKIDEHLFNLIVGLSE